MRFWLFISVFVFVFIGLTAQNLVPNPGFEDVPGACDHPSDYINGPNGYGTIELAPPWTSPFGTANLQASCNDDWPLPLGVDDWWDAYEGTAAAGISIFTIVQSPSTEYIETPLSDKLTLDSVYIVSFKYLGSVGEGNSLAYDNFLGIRFSPTLWQTSPPQPTKFYEADVPLEAELYITDESRDWRTMSWLYRAEGYESWMTIGEFSRKNHSGPQTGASLMLDNFCVMKVPRHQVEVVALRDTVLCESPFSLELATTGQHAGYRWSTGDSTANITVTEPGNYIVEAFLTEECSFFDTVSVRYLDVETFNLGLDRTLCPESFPDTLAVPDGQAYSWNTGANTPDLVVEAPGKYWLVVASACGPLSDTITIDWVHPPDPLALIDSIFCALPVATELEAAPGYDNYIWDGQPGGQAYAVQGEGVYRLQTQSICGNYEDSITLRYQPPLQIGLPTEIVTCKLSDTLISVSAPYSDYLWSTGDTTESIRPNGEGMYTLVATYACGVDTATVRVSLPDARPTVALPTIVRPELGQALQFEPIVNGAGPFRYRWTPTEGLSCMDCAQPTLRSSASGSYSVEVTDRYGCVALASTQVVPNERFDFYAPTAVSPNGDGYNDVFELIVGPQVQEVRQLKVYDRWGGLRHNGAGPRWYPASDALIGVYVWWAELELLNGTSVIVSGDLTLMR